MWGRFTCRKGTRYPLYGRLDWSWGQSGGVRKILLPLGFDHWIVQPLASRCTYYDIPTPTYGVTANEKLRARDWYSLKVPDSCVLFAWLLRKRFLMLRTEFSHIYKAYKWCTYVALSLCSFHLFRQLNVFDTPSVPLMLLARFVTR
jgi:hypothetical protein